MKRSFSLRFFAVYAFILCAMMSNTAAQLLWQNRSTNNPFPSLLGQFNPQKDIRIGLGTFNQDALSGNDVLYPWATTHIYSDIPFPLHNTTQDVGTVLRLQSPHLGTLGVDNTWERNLDGSRSNVRFMNSSLEFWFGELLPVGSSQLWDPSEFNSWRAASIRSFNRTDPYSQRWDGGLSIWAYNPKADAMGSTVAQDREREVMRITSGGVGIFAGGGQAGNRFTDNFAPRAPLQVLNTTFYEGAMLLNTYWGIPDNQQFSYPPGSTTLTPPNNNTLLRIQDGRSGAMGIGTFGNATRFSVDLFGEGNQQTPLVQHRHNTFFVETVAAEADSELVAAIGAKQSWHRLWVNGDLFLGDDAERDPVTNEVLPVDPHKIRWAMGWDDAANTARTDVDKHWIGYHNAGPGQSLFPGTSPWWMTFTADPSSGFIFRDSIDGALFKICGSLSDFGQTANSRTGKRAEFFCSVIIGDSARSGLPTANQNNYKLAVSGKIIAKELVVTNRSWADFVFDEGYALPSLEQVDAFIKENKHLPDIPTAQEVEEQGTNVGDVQAKLLQKIEELTLYMIDMKKENEALKTRLQKLENK